MASRPNLETALEGATIPRDEIRRRLLALINQELALDQDADMPYPENDETLVSILEVAVTQDDIERVVADFVRTQLPSYPANYQRVIEILVSSLPTHLSINQQADMGTVFGAALEQAGLPSSLLDVFFDSLPDALELLSPSVGSEDAEFEFEPMPMDLEDVEVPQPRIYPWFEPSTIIARDPHPPTVPSHSSPSTLDELNDLRIDLNNLKLVLMDINEQMSLMVASPGVTLGIPLCDCRQLLQESATDLDTVLLPDEITPETVSIIKDGLDNSARILINVKNKMFLAEKFIVREEYIDGYVEGGVRLHSAASRYERSRYRDCLRWVISGFRSSRFLDFRIPRSISVPEPTVRAYDESEQTCPVCCEDLPEEGEICPPAAVSFTCCNKGFHTDCLLSSYFAKSRGTPCCPMCRTDLDHKFLEEILEQKVRELQVL